MYCSRYLCRQTVTKHLLTWFCLAWDASALLPSPILMGCSRGPGVWRENYFTPGHVEFWVVRKVTARSRAVVPSSALRESCFPPVWVLPFFFFFLVGVMSSFCEVCAAASSRKTNQGDETWMSNVKKQADLILPLLPPPFLLKRAFKLTLYNRN